MAARLSAMKRPRYSLEFKRKAVKLTQVPGVEVQAVAKGLDLHPVMLSRWRQEARLGRLRGTGEEPPVPKKLVRELKRLQQLEKEHRLLKEEHELPQKPYASLQKQGRSLRVRPGAERGLRSEAAVSDPAG